MSRLELLVYGGIGLLALVPIVWAIVDVLRRPSWQFTPAAKVLWTLTLGVGWLVLWPLSLMLSLFYLFSVRRRLQGRPGPSGGPAMGGPAPGGPAGWAPSATPGRPPGPVPGAPPPVPPGWPPMAAPAPQPAPTPTPTPTPKHLPPAAWYPDPAGGTGQRWWDGRGWSHHTK